MKFRNYNIEKDDSRNWKVTRSDNMIAKMATKTHAIGDAYIRETFVGFTGCVNTAIALVVKDCAGVGCESLQALETQLNELREEIRKLKI